MARFLKQHVLCFVRSCSRTLKPQAQLQPKSEHRSFDLVIIPPRCASTRESPSSPLLSSREGFPHPNYNLSAAAAIKIWTLFGRLGIACKENVPEDSFCFALSTTRLLVHGLELKMNVHTDLILLGFTIHAFEHLHFFRCNHGFCASEEPHVLVVKPPSPSVSRHRHRRNHIPSSSSESYHRHLRYHATVTVGIIPSSSSESYQRNRRYHSTVTVGITPPSPSAPCHRRYHATIIGIMPPSSPSE